MLDLHHFDGGGILGYYYNAPQEVFISLRVVCKSMRTRIQRGSWCTSVDIWNRDARLPDVWYLCFPHDSGFVHFAGLPASTAQVHFLQDGNPIL